MSRSSLGQVASLLAAVLLLCAGGPAAAAAPGPAAAPWGPAAAAPAPAVRMAMASAVFVLPVPTPATVLTPFRAPATAYGPGHRGVDLALAVGGQVRSAGPGTVTHAGAVAGRGTVTVTHPDGLRTTYEPVTAAVRAGQVITAGELIGALQAGHASCAPASCLHWGARLPDGSYLDPMGLITGLQVRLLPWDQARG